MLAHFTSMNNLVQAFRPEKEDEAPAQAIDPGEILSPA
jgi:hypothetical protein